MDEKTNMTISIDKDYYEYLRKISFDLSVAECQKIGLSEVCRRALESMWPMKNEEKG